MNRRLLTVLGFAFLVALGATFLLYGLLANRMQSNSSASTGATVIVAARDLQRGELIKEPDLKTLIWGNPELPKGAYTDRSELLGRGVINEIVAGEPIVESRLAPKEAGAGLAPAIPIGKRAVALRVNDVVSVSGYVIPGSRVDVLITGNRPGANPQGPEIRTILQNVEVLSAGTNIQRDAEGKPIQVPVITVLVTPEEAETISLASNETRIQLVLRNPLDDQKPEPKGTALARLFKGAPAEEPAGPRRAAAPKVVMVKAPEPPPPPPPPPPIVVELLKGPARSSENFEQEPVTP
jgi:pilus assembly protein CpaB